MMHFSNSTIVYPAHRHSTKDGQPLVIVQNQHGRAIIALQGAQVLSFCPTDSIDLLWLSPRSAMYAGRHIRGGIPLCAPWFGPGPDDAPIHGFVRLMPWHLLQYDEMDDGRTHLRFQLRGDANVCKNWPHAFLFELDLIVGRTLELQFTVTNESAATADFAFAFHSYLSVENIDTTTVSGLAGSICIDRLANCTRTIQAGEIDAAKGVDRTYLDVGDTQIVRGAHTVQVRSRTRSAIVWNIGSNDVAFPDLGDGAHHHYLCLERGDVADCAIPLAPGESYHADLILSLVP